MAVRSVLGHLGAAEVGKRGREGGGVVGGRVYWVMTTRVRQVGAETTAGVWHHCGPAQLCS